eukprot:7981208-Alexandrium_andersonii.AAC.1
MVFSLARPGPNAGRQGGVAAIAPRPYTVIPAEDRLPGCCLGVAVARAGGRGREAGGAGDPDSDAWATRNIYKRNVALALRTSPRSRQLATRWGA